MDDKPNTILSGFNGARARIHTELSVQEISVVRDLTTFRKHLVVQFDIQV